jgi:hypothetical protein
VPQTVPQSEQAGPVVPRVDLAVLVEVGHVGKSGGEALIARGAQAGADGVLDVAQAPREGKLLVVGDQLIVEHEHGVLVHAGVDGLHLLGGEGGTGHVHAVDLRSEAGTDLTHRDGHGGRLLGHTVRWRKLVTRGHVRSA